MYLTPAFARRFANSVFYLTAAVRLRRGGADLPALRQAVAQANRIDPAIDMPIALTSQQLTRVNRANDPLVNGLWILALLFGLVGILLAGQSLGRSLSAHADDHAQFRAGGDQRSAYAIELAALGVRRARGRGARRDRGIPLLAVHADRRGPRCGTASGLLAERRLDPGRHRGRLPRHLARRASCAPARRADDITSGRSRSN